MWVLAGLALSYLLLYRERMRSVVDLMDYPLADMEKIGVVTVILPTLNEAATIEQTLRDLEYQNVRLAYPERFQVIVADSSEDETARLASKFDVDLIHPAYGKLIAIDSTIQKAKGNIIVAVDADSCYGSNFLNLILTPFETPEIVGVSGSGIYEGYPFLGVLRETAASVIPRLTGRGSAYRKEAYIATGGFDLTIDQLSSRQMVVEEEFRLWQKLSTLGKVVREERAGVLTSPRRIECWLNKNSPYCEAIEKTRF